MERLLCYVTLISNFTRHVFLAPALSNASPQS
jgi:hypothetical protein